MTTTELNPDAIEAQARQLLDARVATVRELVAARQSAIDARTALAEAERLEAASYAAAERAGWSVDELQKLGLASGSRRTPGRPRTRRAMTKTHPAPAASSAPESPAPQP